MKSIALILFVFLSTNFTTNDQLNLGDKAPKTELKMESVDGKKTSLADLAKENGLCVIFSCNTCPYVIGWEDRYNELEAACAKNKVGFVLVNSNEAKRDGDDSLSEMKAHAKEKGYGKYAYVVDENHVVADAFGATKTPDVFLFNGKMELAYKGAIDDNMKQKDSVTEPYLKNAVEAMVAGKPINPGETKAIGCSIKRNS
ncbi:MAG: thioredoxin family protein [Flavobacteriales bacterium]|nr:thioredoxin family protein [Flavobacteriales bacterium]